MRSGMTAATTAFATPTEPLTAGPPTGRQVMARHVMARRMTTGQATAGHVVLVPAGPVIAIGPSHRTGPR
ncbi:hypothetical protein FDG2_4886 [Candidatus Protofrankia californiensis]|uniref:Uncharacterized protein n=1 Tax=Candidatus Protofrankia californiensis TaxID=1839754 RepID=A0A1C3P9S5_9ACTN|nr:hypothetical protein FDG2_4886 [Candidatus Protofrankia californiensis]